MKMIFGDPFFSGFIVFFPKLIWVLPFAGAQARENLNMSLSIWSSYILLHKGTRTWLPPSPNLPASLGSSGPVGCQDIGSSEKQIVVDLFEKVYNHRDTKALIPRIYCPEYKSQIFINMVWYPVLNQPCTKSDLVPLRSVR